MEKLDKRGTGCSFCFSLVFPLKICFSFFCINESDFKELPIQYATKRNSKDISQHLIDLRFIS